MNKQKIINDPVYGFIHVPSALVFDIISHPYFQRLRRIKQMGLADYVYPGATHSRFHHALGAMHLMHLALDVLKSKGHPISVEEEEGAILAILLHDIGHGPYSHTLESTIVKDVHHEYISTLMQSALNKTFGGKLDLAIRIFNGTYPKYFLHQLVSGQLDVDRMDYLNRDSFYTGVAEGVIGYDRIIKMLDVYNDKLVVEEKGIYSIEKFIVSRRLMYWQVYLHKASIAADHMLMSVLERAQFLIREKGVSLPASPALMHFLSQDVREEDFSENPEHLRMFSQLDDTDILHALKLWQNHDDVILQFLSRGLIDRKIFKLQYCENGQEKEKMEQIKSSFLSTHPELTGMDDYLFLEGKVTNNAYIPGRDSIDIKMKDGTVRDIAEVAEVLTIRSLSNPVVKQYICHPQI
jgi:HD superfamily phosphohydrolase